MLDKGWSASAVLFLRRHKNICTLDKGISLCGGACIGLSVVESLFFHQLVISCVWVISPLIWSIEFLDESFGQKSFHVAKEDNVILAVEVNPAAVAVLGMLALHLT